MRNPNKGSPLNSSIDKNNARKTNYFTNCWVSKWLLVNEKIILILIKNDINGGFRWKPIKCWSYQQFVK